ncbi:DUF2147 domain-containing protein [Legionella oakridgensis]|uniref:DUF2147 domain-containing protein n=2 Tax=Legionella oakridgensis TaxID=29423 RepID=W0BGB7_9GAMM|nr:DUF2147 domain-containing protein [Legionella oakridgensis]AHE67479.1 hypothetical protein Loa_01933 [Legionella oakridgensis ATCC 33761 = DSM 21215]ETO93008.1 hypothetical protein LOR_44c07360 [Legionella oakridgensis RV-2-2007]KTD43536.1 putative signal peptide protein [Legionella oakridgensis]STY20528.1 putative signal peptide protein [Legionella longbeachae]
MKQWKQCFLLVLAVLYLPSGFAQSLTGLWTTMDDKTGKKRAVVRLNLDDGVLSGTIVRVYKQPEDTGICSKCPGQFKNQPIEGLTFLWGLKDKGKGVWEGGEILDPKSGKVYKAKLTEKGDKLYVRGYVGLSMLGRTQVWLRAKQ